MSAKYHIYCHNDADGGIAAAILLASLTETTQHHTDKLSLGDVSVSPQMHGEQRPWWANQIQVPCAILDFALHPALLTSKIFQDSLWGMTLPSFWIDHHETSCPFDFLSETKLLAAKPNGVPLTLLWDKKANSTPGLMREERRKLGFSDQFLFDFDELIDLAEVVDGALFHSAKQLGDFDDPAIALMTLLSPAHPCVRFDTLFRQMVHQMSILKAPDRVIRADPLYKAILEFAKSERSHSKRLYEAAAHERGQVAVFDFREHTAPPKMDRFLPYELCPSAAYAVQIHPKHQRRGSPPTGKGAECSITCGENPWHPLRRRPLDSRFNLAQHFLEHFQGGGHRFVAGGRVHQGNAHLVDSLIESLNSNVKSEGPG